MVDSFSQEDAFHQAFGTGTELLTKDEIAFLFIRLIRLRRQNPIRHLVTVRRNRKLVAMISGSLTGTRSSIDNFSEAVNSGDIALTIRDEAPSHLLEEYCAKKARTHGAVQNDVLTKKFDVYQTLIEANLLADTTNTIYFSLGIVAVDPAEQRKGHLAAMLDRLVGTLGKSVSVNHIHVSTYDQKLVEIYTELGFESAEKLQVDDITAWQLILPLHK